MKLSRGIKNRSTFPFSPWDRPCLAVGTIILLENNLLILRFCSTYHDLDDIVHSASTLTGGLLSVFMLLEQLFKVVPCGLVQDLAGTLSFSLCQTAHDLENLAGI